MKLPETFEIKMKQLLGQEEFEQYLDSYELPKYQGIRINTLKVDLDIWKKINPFATLKEVPWCHEGFYYQLEDKPSKHPYYYAGLYYIQEPSAMSPGAYLPVEEGDKVLDLCAAPGGKSTQVAAKLNHTGLLVANDISASRAKVLAKNLENFGVSNMIVTAEKPEKLATAWPGFFDKILIDAPCSGEGMFRKDESAIKSWETHGIDYCIALQEDILESAAKLLKPSGMMLYSTCTFSPEENEQMIKAFLLKHPEFSVKPLEAVGGIKHARPDWADAPAQLEGALRLWPHHLEGEGHFVCLLERKEIGSTYAGDYIKQQPLKMFKEAYTFFKDYTVLADSLLVMEQKGKLYNLPEETPDLQGIRVIRSGLLLGEIKPKRFEPSHALVLAYAKEDFKTTIDWSIEEDKVWRYLKGETIIEEASKGYHVICVEGYPLGWVKAQNGMLKNQYPTSWRMIGS